MRCVGRAGHAGGRRRGQALWGGTGTDAPLSPRFTQGLETGDHKIAHASLLVTVLVDDDDDGRKEADDGRKEADDGRDRKEADPGREGGDIRVLRS